MPPEVSIGTAFNVASVLNVHLFEADEAEMKRLHHQRGEMVSLLPRSAVRPGLSCGTERPQI